MAKRPRFVVPNDLGDDIEDSGLDHHISEFESVLKLQGSLGELHSKIDSVLEKWYLSAYRGLVKFIKWTEKMKDGGYNWEDPNISFVIRGIDNTGPPKNCFQWIQHIQILLRKVYTLQRTGRNEILSVVGIIEQALNISLELIKRFEVSPVVPPVVGDNEHE